MARFTVSVRSVTGRGSTHRVTAPSELDAIQAVARKLYGKNGKWKNLETTEEAYVGTFVVQENSVYIETEEFAARVRPGYGQVPRRW